ncbi:MAG: hypothetical protein KGO01_22485 [Burkholderiales bacterium]|nr:hypothetical protein [Burkholderiales bacterium]
MHTPTSPEPSLKHGIAVAALVLLSIPGVATVLSPIAMTLASAVAHAAAPTHAVAAASASNGSRAG